MVQRFIFRRIDSKTGHVTYEHALEEEGRKINEVDAIERATAKLYDYLKLTVLTGCKPGLNQFLIYYDVLDVDGESLEIMIEASNDNGSSWTLPCTTLSGDVGYGVHSGSNKHVVWEFFTDNPYVSGNSFRIRVTAFDQVVVDIDGNIYHTIQIGDWYRPLSLLPIFQ